MAAKQGFLMYYSKGDAIGTRVSVRYRRSGRLSEVVVKRGSTVILHSLYAVPKVLHTKQLVRLRTKWLSEHCFHMQGGHYGSHVCV